MNANGEANNNPNIVGSAERTGLSKYWSLSVSRVKSAFVFLWLCLLYFVLLFAVIGTLSSYQFQQRVKQFVVDETATVNSVIADARELERAKKRLPELEKQLADLDIESQVVDESVETDLWFRLNPFYDDLDAIFITNGFSSEEVGELYTPDDYANFLISNSHRLEFDQVLAIETLIDQFRPMYQEAVEAMEAADGQTETQLNRDAQKKWTALRLERQELQKLVTDVDNKILVINDELAVLDSVCVGPFNNLGPFCFGMFAKQTSAVLVLFLTLAMGMLGSTIFITQEYVIRGSGNRPITWFLIRPALGMVTAIAIFVLAKAGQLGLSESADNLNPWVISFLAVISGLLSEHAVERIGRSAKPIFDPDASQLPRWGVALEAKLEELGIDRDELASALNVTRAKLDDWASQKYSVPHREQELIASWLRIPVRDIFTDIAPDGNGNTESALA